MKHPDFVFDDFDQKLERIVEGLNFMVNSNDEEKMEEPISSEILEDTDHFASHQETSPIVKM